MIYDVAPGRCIVVERTLDEEELDQARSDYAGGIPLDVIASAHGGRVHTPPLVKPSHVAVDVERLKAIAAERGVTLDELLAG